MFSFNSRRRKRVKNIDINTNNVSVLNEKEMVKNPSPIQKQSTVNMLNTSNKEKNNTGIPISFVKKQILDHKIKENEKQQNFDFRNYIQNIETDEIKYNKQLRIEEEDKYKAWIKNEE
jgi:hypothetical protein